jgi:hypothetical protein
VRYVIKYFFEEPASLEVLSGDDDPDARRTHTPAMSLEDFLGSPAYFRGYLTATDLWERRFGFSTLPADVAAGMLNAVVADRNVQTWKRHAVDPATDVRSAVLNPDAIGVIAVGGHGIDPSVARTLFTADRRRSIPALREILDSGTLVLFPEPAQDGVDWSLFAAHPFRSSVERALTSVTGHDRRAFSIPHARARSEEKFYFELYDLERFAECEVTE